MSSKESPFSEKDKWHVGSVKIHIPHEGTEFSTKEDASLFEVKRIVYHDIIEDPVACKYHYTPHKLYCQHSAQPVPSPPLPIPSDSSSTPVTPDIEETRIYSKAYISNGILEENTHIQNPQQPGNSLKIEYTICPIYISSDSTMVAKFGHHSL